MALAECQVQVRDLVMGPGTPFRVLPGFNPFTTRVRAAQGGPRAWNHGSWSGAEWAEEKVVPIPLSVTAPTRDIAGWLTLQQQLAKAFAPVADLAEQVELRFRYGREFVLFGRPRMAVPRTDIIAVGKAAVDCAFVAQDPRIYDATQSTTGPVDLPVQGGGLLLPAQLPLTVGGTLFGGEAVLVNEGTTDAGLSMRIDGPARDPVVILTRPDGSIQEIRFDLTLLGGQWVEVDSAARTAFLNSLPTSSVRGLAAWDMDPYPLPPGSSLVRFRAEDEAAGTLTVQWRSAWW